MARSRRRATTSTAAWACAPWPARRPASPTPTRSPPTPWPRPAAPRSEEHTSELQSRPHLVCRLLLEKKKKKKLINTVVLHSEYVHDMVAMIILDRIVLAFCQINVVRLLLKGR